MLKLRKLLFGIQASDLTPKQPKTVCYNCRNFFNAEPIGSHSDIWYNHYCLASPKPRKIDPVTGKERNAAYDRYRYCRDVNTGNCKLYEQIVWQDSESTDENLPDDTEQV